MKKLVLSVLAVWITWASLAGAQPGTSYSAAQAHSHNDYQQSIPFWQAYDQAFGSMETDIYARNGQLYVAHNPAGITSSRTLDALYITPIVEKVRANKGKLYADATYGLQWLIDLKTPARLSLPILVRALGAYPEIFGSGGVVTVIVSGYVPPPDQFSQYPDWLQFDGRPNIAYTPEQLAHVGLISQAFPYYIRWNGKGQLGKRKRTKIQTVIQQVHRQGKKIRFWATPDNINTWKTLMSMGVDYINTDQITPLGHFLHQHLMAEYQKTYTLERVNEYRKRL